MAVLVGLLAALLALGGLASVRSGGAFETFAQTPGPTIKLVNPESATSREISAKPDGVDSAYHLVAWVNQVPPAASVQFTYTPPGENQRERTIQCRDTGTSLARFVSPDTFDCFWELAGVAPASGGTLRAVLYSNDNVVATDQETLSITGGQTVEITYPSKGDRWASTPSPTGPRSAGSSSRPAGRAVRATRARRPSSPITPRPLRAPSPRSSHAAAPPQRRSRPRRVARPIPCAARCAMTSRTRPRTRTTTPLR